MFANFRQLLAEISEDERIVYDFDPAILHPMIDLTPRNCRGIIQLVTE